MPWLVRASWLLFLYAFFYVTRRDNRLPLPTELSFSVAAVACCIGQLYSVLFALACLHAKLSFRAIRWLGLMALFVTYWGAGLWFIALCSLWIDALGAMYLEIPGFVHSESLLARILP
ncbi:hypothetical protein AURDEDRAFT_163106 [Auricularia subglabra TFB-10046 SS5]|nr:hypothetical protein AURDEDRAFT_163106 [Auricularia subglabra TFB-10046 SS5]